MDTLNRRTSTKADAEALFETLCQAWNAGNPEGIAAGFAADGRLVDPFGNEWDGIDAVTTAYVETLNGVLAGTTTEVVIDSVRELAPGLAVVDAWQTFSGPLPRMHLTAIVRSEGDTVRIVEGRPYILLEMPSSS
jgi:uncharacterized protein (TIGR02246 family)